MRSAFVSDPGTCWFVATTISGTQGAAPDSSSVTQKPLAYHVETLSRVVIVALVVEDFRHLALGAEDGRAHETRSVDSPHDDISIALGHGETGEEARECENQVEVEAHDVDSTSLEEHLSPCEACVVAELTPDVDGVNGVLLHVENGLAPVANTANEQHIEGSREERLHAMTRWNCSIACDRAS